MMLTILDFAKLAAFIYKDEVIVQKMAGSYIRNIDPIYSDTFKPALVTDGVYEITVDRFVQSIPALKNDFYASFFVKVENGKVVGGVVAIRGTVPSLWGNDEADIRSWWETVFDEKVSPISPVRYTQQAYAFFAKVRRYNLETLKIPPLSMFFTGHSLGGAIAALMPTQYSLLARAVTFNAPGIAGMNGVRDLSDFVLNFRAEYDFVSAIGEPIGNQFSYVVPEEREAAQQAFAYAEEHSKKAITRANLIGDVMEYTDFFKSVMDQHSMTNLLKRLEGARGINNKPLEVDTYASIDGLCARPKTQYDSPFNKVKV